MKAIVMTVLAAILGMLPIHLMGDDKWEFGTKQLPIDIEMYYAKHIGDQAPLSLNCVYSGATPDSNFPARRRQVFADVGTWHALTTPAGVYPGLFDPYEIKQGIKYKFGDGGPDGHVGDFTRATGWFVTSYGDYILPYNKANRHFFEQLKSRGWLLMNIPLSHGYGIRFYQPLNGAAVAIDKLFAACEQKW